MKHRIIAIALTLLAAATIAGCSAAPGDTDDQADNEETTSTGEELNQSDGKASLLFVNHCSYTVAAGRTGSPPFARLSPGGQVARTLGSDSKEYASLAYYGFRDGRDPGGGNETLAEMTLNATNNGRADSYNVSLVDAYSLPMGIRPIGGSCGLAVCAEQLLAGCPASARIVKNGITISCSKKGDKDNPNNPAAVYFNQRCPHAFAWSTDNSAVVTCHAQDYQITFCP